ncbi:hypothetical protein AX17_000115 [Amanita inopinata Kibby_2008]|nr:hypothetical protein AX17_000115 [Amanita inopinata Kibby_2008]
MSQTQSDGSTSIFRPINLPLEQYGLEGYSYKMVCASWETTYIVLAHQDKGHILISMGADDFGDLGIGKGRRTGREKGNAEPLHIVGFDHIKLDGLSCRPDKTFVQHLSAGQHHVVAHLQTILSDGSTRYILVGWGTSRHGQLGAPSSQDDKRPAVRPFSPAPKLIASDAPTPPIAALSLGMQHTVFLRTSGHVSGIGSNRKCQLSGIESLSHVRAVGCTWSGTYAVVDDGSNNWQVMSTGSNTHGQLGRTGGDGNRDASSSIAAVEFPEMLKSSTLNAIACGSEHILCLFITELETPRASKSEVWGWGWNEHGNLGLGMSDDVHVPVRVWPDTHDHPMNIVDLWAGCGTSWLYSKD